MNALPTVAERPEHGLYPVHVEADLDPDLSRGLWLVKWLLAIPHYVVLAFLWAAFAVLSVAAFFAILVTGHYPRAIFDFNVGVMRWSWRVSYYAYGALGTDRYPPFTLADVPDYPAHLDVDPPGELSRGLVLVKWWLLAIPHYLIVGLFAGGLAYGVLGADDETWISVSLIGALVLVAAVALLFTGRYPRELFDLVLGLNRWVLRVAGYVALMTDQYPPFRLDQGGHEGEGGSAPRVPATRAPETTHPASPPSAWTAGRVVAVVAGCVLVMMGTVLAGAGGTLAVAGATEREEGFLMSPTLTLESDVFAITSPDARIHLDDAPSWVPDAIVGDVRISASTASDAPLFLGLARTSDVDAYLAEVAHDTLDDVRDGGEPVYTSSAGGAPATAPGDQDFWASKATGTDATLTWALTEGEWSVVLMNQDGSAAVSAEVATGAELPIISTMISVLFILAGLALLVGVLLIAVPVRAATRSRS